MFARNLYGDCLDVLRDEPDNSFQLICTSPPYADARKKTYGGVPPDKYVEWFLPRAAEFKRVLHPEGTFILNIKEGVVDGERHEYVMDLVRALRKQGWLWTEEWMWHKTTSAPGKWPNRFRDAWEHVHQFNKQRKFNMYQDTVKVPIGDWAEKRLASLNENEKARRKSVTGSGVGTNLSHWTDRDMVYPDNVLHLPVVCTDLGHSAVYPESLPEFFIKLFTKVEDTVLDPFAGSGTTGVAAIHLRRNYMGIDILEKNVDVAKNRLPGVPHMTLEEVEQWDEGDSLKES